MSKNTRIAKNTLILYIRMFITMSIGLYTSRIVLNALGIENYGIYNVVGGVVAMFSFFTTSLSTAISRYLTFTLGKKNKEFLNIVFSTSVIIQVVIATIIVILAEFIGIWFLNTQMNIPVNRVEAANWVIHCSIAMFFISVITVPYHAAIIAHEQMNAFAYISIFESILKLAVAFSLYYISFDSLKSYAILLLIIQIVIFISNLLYCTFNFHECRFHYVVDKKLVKEMTGFASWNLVGSGAYLFNTQGINIITNIYFGVTVNAARGIANQANGMMMQFVNNFTTALNPQITKSYAEGNLEYLHKLVCKGAKYSYFLMLFFFVPLMFEVEFVLDIWLKKYPDEAPLFLRLIMIGQMIDFLGNSTARAVWATGKVKKYYILTGLIGPLVFPLSCFLFYLGLSAEWSYWAYIFVYCLLIPVRLHVLNGLTGFKPKVFYKEVILRVAFVTCTSLTLPLLVISLLNNDKIANVSIVIICLVSVAICIYFFGIDAIEKNYIKESICRKINRFKKDYL